ncbi:unnamed protein product [Tenebrio molitor]|nr:unnamed protein product [Tenebrio molitor]
MYPTLKNEIIASPYAKHREWYIFISRRINIFYYKCL